MRLEGKVAIVTGTGSGIGEATAARFAVEGASVVANGLGATSLCATVSGLVGSGHQAVVGDLAAGLQFAKFGYSFERIRVVDTHRDAIDTRRRAQGSNHSDQHGYPDYLEERSVGFAPDFREWVRRVATPCEYECVEPVHWERPL